jgi:hypothetical protein
MNSRRFYLVFSIALRAWLTNNQSVCLAFLGIFDFQAWHRLLVSSRARIVALQRMNMIQIFLPQGMTTTLQPLTNQE